jgi:hypothetical protein
LRSCAFANVLLPLTVARSSTPAAGEIPPEDVRLVTDWLQSTLVEKHDTFIAVMFYKKSWWVRLSGQIYLEVGDFEWAGNVLKNLCHEVKQGGYKVEDKMGKLSIG